MSNNNNNSNSSLDKGKGKATLQDPTVAAAPQRDMEDSGYDTTRISTHRRRATGSVLGKVPAEDWARNRLRKSWDGREKTVRMFDRLHHNQLTLTAETTLVRTVRNLTTRHPQELQSERQRVTSSTLLHHRLANRCREKSVTASTRVLCWEQTSHRRCKTAHHSRSDPGNCPPLIGDSKVVSYNGWAMSGQRYRR